MIRRIAAILAALGLMVLMVTPALANDLANGNPDGIPSTSTGFPPGEGDCTGVQPGQVVWHFIHTGTTEADLPSSLTATFEGGVTVTVAGYTQDEGNGQGSVVMYDVPTGPNTLITASDTIIDDGRLNLSHICDGGPPPDVPEAPASVLLLLTAALAGLAFVGWKMRTNAASA